MDRLSIFAAVASEVVASLVSRYEKTHPHEKWRIVVIFLWAFVNELWLTEKERKKKKQNGHVCGGITQLHKRLGKLRG